MRHRQSPQIFKSTWTTEITLVVIGFLLMVNGCRINRNTVAYADDKIKVIRSMVDTSFTTIREVFTIDTIIKADTIFKDTIIRAGRTVIENHRQKLIINYDPDTRHVSMTSILKDIPVIGNMDRVTTKQNQIHDTTTSTPASATAGVAIVIIALALLAHLVIKIIELRRNRGA